MKWLVPLMLVPAVATADVWQHAADRGAAARRAAYEAKLAAGDDAALAANARGVAPSNVRELVDKAVAAYKEAAALEPKEGEPFYRIGRVLYSFYFECSRELVLSHVQPSPICNPLRFDSRRAAQVIDAWDTFEARTPLDPRLSADLGESEILFDRAILHTKLITPEHLTAAAADYEKILSRGDGIGLSHSTVWSNLAETYMMLGRLDDAIDTYREALHRGGDPSTQYGLAVALDRDNRGEEAKDRIAQLGEAPYQEFKRHVESGSTFFVPEGEKFYYFALADETFGRYDEALEMWRAYIRSNAHPEFQPRAKAHIEWINAERKKHPMRVTPPPLPEEMPY